MKHVVTTSTTTIVACSLLASACTSGSGSNASVASAPPATATVASSTDHSSATNTTTTTDATTTNTSNATATSTTTPSATSTSLPMSIAAGEQWIVYEGPIDDGAGNRLVRPDGSDDHWATPQVPLRKDGWQVHPDWSPDGTMLAFAADDASDDGKPEPVRTRDLWISHPDGTQAERVFECSLPCIEADDPAWSPDGRTLAFRSFGGDSTSMNMRLALIDVATRTVTTVTTASGADAFRGPRWSPDGHRLVFELQHWTDPGPNGKLAETALAIVDLRVEHPTPTVITDWSLWANYPDWHPTEDLIVFSTRPWNDLEEGPSNLYTVKPDGTGLTQLTDLGATRAVQPSWTPDGAAIIFTQVKGTGFGHPTMQIVQRDGTQLRSATSNHPMFGTHPRLRRSAAT